MALGRAQAGRWGSRACHRGVANRVTRGSLLLLGQTDTFKTAALAPAQESQLACAALKNRALSHRCKCVVRIRHPLGSLCSIHLECLSVYTILGQWAPALRAVGEAKQDPMAFSVVAEGRPGHPPGCRTGMHTGESRDVVVSRRIAGCQLRRLDNSQGGSPHGMDRIFEKLPHPDRAVARLLFLCKDRSYNRSVDPGRISGRQLRRSVDSQGGSLHGMDRILERLPHPDLAVDRLLFLCDPIRWDGMLPPSDIRWQLCRGGSDTVQVLSGRQPSSRCRFSCLCLPQPAMHSSVTVAGALAAIVLATLAAAVVATVTATIVASVAATHVRAYHDSSSPSFAIHTDALCGAGIDALGQISTCCFCLLMVLQTPYATLTPGFFLRTIRAPRSDGMHILGSLVVILLIVVLIIL
jgi:hypothetical protein